MLGNGFLLAHWQNYACLDTPGQEGDSAIALRPKGGRCDPCQVREGMANVCQRPAYWSHLLIGVMDPVREEK